MADKKIDNAKPASCSGKVSPDLLKAAHTKILDPSFRGFSHIPWVKMPRRKVL